MKTELKVRAAGLATYLACTIGLALLGTLAGSNFTGLPNWVDVLVLPLVPAAASVMAGYRQRSKPAWLAESTLAAARSRLGTAEDRA